MLKNIADEFEKLLNENKDEQAYQDFLEKNTALIPTNLCVLNHDVHFDFIISKLRISQNFTTDFCYLTKSTQEWYVVLVEIEKPSKKIFKRNGNNFEFSSDFNSALEQINTWKIELEKNKSILDDLKPLIGFNPEFLKNPVTFKYILIYGRGSELDNDLKKQKFIMAKNQHEVLIVTYDSLISNFKTPRFCNMTQEYNCKNIVTKRTNGFKMKYLNSLSKDWIAWMKPSELDLTSEQKDYLRKEGVLIDEWEGGKELCNFGKVLKNDVFRAIFKS